jgi:hypothetical protein
MDAETPWATYGTNSDPLVVEYGAATGAFGATGLGALKGSGYAALPSGRAHARITLADKRLRTTPPLALALRRRLSAAPGFEVDGLVLPREVAAREWAGPLGSLHTLSVGAPARFAPALLI